MIAIPAVDLKDGRCVQLVGGDPEEERVSLSDPAAVAARWQDSGFGSLHVVDLDAALGRGENSRAIRTILERSRATVQVGGGVRSTDRVRELVEAGADRVVVGTRAVEDPEWLAGVAASFPDTIVVAADIRGDEVVIRGWQAEAGMGVEALLGALAPLPLAGVLCTDVGREGRMRGVDRSAVREIVEGTEHSVWIAGGIGSKQDLLFLDEVGAAGAVLGMALYTGALDGESVAKEFGR